MDDAIEDCQIVAVVIGEGSPTRRQSAMLQLIPTGVSIAQSILCLVKNGYLPSAHALLRTLFEFTGISSLVETSEDWLEFWEEGWPKSKKRPSLTTLISHIAGENPQELEAIHRLAGEFHLAVHVTPEGASKYLAPNEHGANVHWFGPITTAPDLAGNICHAAALCAVVLASNAKRAFFWNAKDPPPT